MKLFRSFWAFVKLFHLYVTYWLVGATPDYFYINKANYFYQLGWHRRAIRNYKRALEDSNDPRIHSMIRYCYSQLGHDDESIEYYRKSYKETNNPHVALGLAAAELDRGNLDESKKIVQEMRKEDHQFKTTEIDFLEAEIGLAQKEREYLEHTKNEFKRGK